MTSSDRHSPTDNVFIRLIHQGRIEDLDDLKRAYRRLVMRTHPDAIGSTQLVQKFLEFGECYETAKIYLASRTQTHLIGDPKASTNHRLEFFTLLKELEALDAPYAFHRDHARIGAVKARATEAFKGWGSREVGLFRKADLEHDRIKGERPEGPYLKKALGLNLRPVFHNVIMFHLTGRMVYKKQVRQNLSAILDRLQMGRHFALREYVEFLVADLENGAAVFEDRA
jgi:hypothetical protein